MYRIPMQWRSQLGQWRQRAAIEDGLLTVETTMDPVQRAVILERNARLRRENPLQNLSFGALVLTIPEEDYYSLLRTRPALKAGDKAIRERAWRDFMASPEAAPYKVRDTRGGLV